MDTATTKKRVEELVSRAQDEIVASSRDLADAITRETGRNVPPIGEELTRIIDEVFDFAQGVIEGQRRMVSEVLATLSDTLEEASVRSAPKTTTRKRATAKKAPAKKAPAKKAPAKKTAAKKASARKAPAKKAPARKASSSGR